jgi:hypothetical protein
MMAEKELWNAWSIGFSEKRQGVGGTTEVNSTVERPASKWLMTSQLLGPR